MSKWRVVDLIDFGGALKDGRGRLVADGQELELADVAVVLIGPRVSVTAGVLGLVAKYDACLVTCDWRGRPLSATTGLSHNSRVAARHRAQAALSKPRRKNAWMHLVAAKVAGQGSNLELRHPSTAERLRALSRRVRSGDPDNVEAQAARTYWSRMFDGGEFTRIPGGIDNTNSLLNYGYAILRASVIRAIVAAGLIPALGLHHSNRANAFVLADDLIEPFRPAVDWATRRLPPDSWLIDPDVKRALVDVLTCQMAPDAQSVQAEIDHLAQRLARYAEGEEQTLIVPRWRAPAL